MVAVEDYQNLLDRFKITLNFPVGAAIKLDENELTKIEAIAREPLEVALDDAVATALRRRLDLLNARGQAEDADRRVRVSADALRTQLDLNLTASLPSKSSGVQKPFKLDASEGIYSVGFDLDLPFDRRAERNDYVASLIDKEQEARAAALLEDRVTVNVRDAHRRLLRERQTLKIQEASVKLAEARVESTNLLRDAGRALTRDLLDAQAALVSAKNGFTAALINLAIARLEFFRDTGALKVADGGRWIEEPIPRQGP